jgi:muconolactone delta-isomerase
MNEYMIVVKFPPLLNKEFISLIPEQRAEVNRLMEKGILTSYSLSSDRTILWITFLATSSEAVEITLRMMPLYKFMTYEIIELMFHNNPVYTPMHFSVN